MTLFRLIAREGSGADQTSHYKLLHVVHISGKVHNNCMKGILTETVGVLKYNAPLSPFIAPNTVNNYSKVDSVAVVVLCNMAHTQQKSICYFSKKMLVL